MSTSLTTSSAATHLIPSSSTSQNYPSVSSSYLPYPSHTAPHPTNLTNSSTVPTPLGLPHWMLYVYVGAGVVAFLLLLCVCFLLFTCLVRAGRRRHLKQQLLPLYQMEQEYSDEEDELLMRDSDYTHRRGIESVTIQPILSFES